MPLQISISNAIGSRGVTAAGGFDPDAQAFITAASITDPTQQAAINQLVVDLKGYSIWSKMKAIYPFVGGTASQHKWNLKDPRDLNAAFRLVFSGGWTHSANGAQPNGTNGYANTYLTPSTALTLNSSQLSLYSRTSTITNGQRDFGAYTNLNPPAIALGTNTGVFISDQYNYFTQRISASITAATGFYTGTRTSATSHKLFKNGSVIGTDTSTNSTALPGINLFLGAINSDPTDTAPSAYSNKQYAFASIGDGLTDAEAANFYTAVQAFQTTLGRSIGTQTVSDADAQAFVTNAGIVDQVEANAINNLVIGLKADSLWTKMQAVYPFVGGSSSTMKYNLVNPLDTDAAFRLVFNGGATFSSTGYLPNGTNGYADTKLIAQGTLGLNSTSYGVYSRTNVDRNAPSMGNVTGAAPAECSLWLRSSNTAYLRVNNSTNASQASTDSRGLFIANRASSTQINLQIRGTQYTYSNNSNSLSTNVFQIGGVNPNFFDNKEIAFSFIGDGLTSQNMTDLDSRVTTFQTALNRNV